MHSNRNETEKSKASRLPDIVRAREHGQEYRKMKSALPLTLGETTLMQGNAYPINAGNYTASEGAIGPRG